MKSFLLLLSIMFGISDALPFEKFPLDGLDAEQVGRDFCVAWLNGLPEKAKSLATPDLDQVIDDEDVQMKKRDKEHIRLREQVVTSQLAIGYLVPLRGDLEQRDLSLQSFDRFSIFALASWSVVVGDREKWKIPGGGPLICSAAMKFKCVQLNKFQKALNWIGDLPIIREFLPNLVSSCYWKVFDFHSIYRSKYVDWLSKKGNQTAPPEELGGVDYEALAVFLMALGDRKLKEQEMAEEKKAREELAGLHSKLIGAAD